MITHTLTSFFDELEKIAAPPVVEKALRKGTKWLSGGGLRKGQWPRGLGALADARAHGELLRGRPVPSQTAAGEFLARTFAKTGGLVDAVIKNVATNPVKYYAASKRHEAGKKRHRQTLEALEHPYPASWVPLGMRPE